MTEYKQAVKDCIEIVRRLRMRSPIEVYADDVERALLDHLAGQG
jgi:uncharacterized protein YeeX (DUF496 family)